LTDRPIGRKFAAKGKAMCPAHDGDPHDAFGRSLRPGGGTYAVRPAATAHHPAAPPAPPPARPQRPLAPRTHTSPRGIVSVVLIGIGLATVALLGLAVSGYLPDSGSSIEPQAEPMPTVDPDS
jgi:hypothetical protein